MPSEILPLEPDTGPFSKDALLLRDLHRIAGRSCVSCRRICSPFEAVWSIALGFKDAPRCLDCLGRGLDRDPTELRSELMAYIERHECYRRAWVEAASLNARLQPVSPDVPEPSVLDMTQPGLTWDAGDMGCGDLVLALRIRLNGLPAGTLLQVRATDPGAPQDIPAWCRLTGHDLVSADHPLYLIRRKGA